MSTGRINLDLSVPPVTQRPQRVALVVGIVFGIASIVGLVLAPDQFFRSYLLGWTLGMGLSLGCMAFIMLYYVTGGIWGQPIRRPLEAGMRNIWLMMVLFIPILTQLKRLYPWARPAEIAHDEHLLHIVHQYLRPELFWVRTAIYFTIWGILVYTLSRWSSLQDVPPEKDFAARFRNLSAPGLVLYGFTITFASIDWVMSLDPRWASTIYGLLFLAGQGLSAICFVVIIVVWLWKYSPMRELMKPDYLQDHGKLMITFVMLWAYFTLSQWLITCAAARVCGNSRFVHALGGYVLVHRAELPRSSDTFPPQPAGRRRAHCYRGFLAVFVFPEFALASVVRALRSAHDFADGA
jgi:multisubunit Na+/H+ antiporter MnhG subunit